MSDKLDIYNPDELNKIKWMCGDVYITTDRQVFNVYTLNKLSERLVNSSYGYTIDGKFRTNKWINEHSFNVQGIITI